MRGLGPIVLVTAGVLAPSAASAHAAGRGLILLLPTRYYLIGGAVAVAVSFAVLALVPRVAGFGGRIRLAVRWPPVAGGLRWLAFTAFAALIAAGFLGPTDPLDNPLPLTVWTLWWVGYTALTALVGDLWPLLNPWSAPVGLLRRLGLRPALRSALRLPGGAGYWPALAGLFGFVWLEIVSPAPADPAGLARAAGLYWLVHFVAMLAVGERRWRARGETFSVFFRLVGRIAPLRIGPRRLELAWPGSRLARGRVLPLSGWLFVTALIASISFDGLSATFRWLTWLGINPLDFPGRSAVVTQNTAGLAGAWAALALAYAGAVAAGARLAGSRADLGTTLGRIALSLVPIALAYHLAHYLTILMLNGQYALALVAEAVGLDHVHVTGSFLNKLRTVEAIWRVQTAIIVTGHVLAVAVAHAIALHLERDPRRAALSQLPLAALMVGLTVLGLWLLSTPTGA